MSNKVAKEIQERRKHKLSESELIAKILAGDKVALSRAITLIESTNPEHLPKANEVIKGCLPYANNSIWVIKLIAISLAIILCNKKLFPVSGKEFFKK